MSESAIVKEDKGRRFAQVVGRLVVIVAIASSIFQLYIACTGVLESYKMRTLHLLFLLPLSFLIYPMRKSGRFSTVGVIDIAWFVTSMGAMAYLGIIHYSRLTQRSMFVGPLLVTDVIIGIFVVVAVLEATRRCVGWGMVLISLAAIAYALFGNRIPGELGHSGTSWLRLVETLSLTTNGIFGSTVGASATFIFLFVLFGEFLNASGAGQFFIDIAYSLTGSAKGGPAKMAVVASCLMGSVSGSSTANVTSTGAYTIPLMKKMGYKNDFAGAVEAAASTGGGIMPPVMGACAFLMAEYVGIPYFSLCIAAFIPALLYYLSVGFAVHFEATRLDLRGVEETPPHWLGVLRERGHLSLPLLVIIVTMMLGMSAYRAAFYAIISCIFLCFLKKETRLTWKSFFAALSNGAKGAVMIAITCATAGIVIGVTAETGIAVKFASLVINIAGGKLFLLLPLVMIASLILGMGLPASAAYIMVAAIAVPALVQMGLPALGSHLFALYFGIFSGITPPVAIAAFAAAGLAGAKPMVTGFKAVWVALPAFVIPYVFIIQEGLLLQGTLQDIAVCVVSTAVGCVFIPMATVGCIYKPINPIFRVFIFVVAMLMMLSSDNLVMLLCLAALLAVFLFHRTLFRRETANAAPAQ